MRWSYFAKLGSESWLDPRRLSSRPLGRLSFWSKVLIASFPRHAAITGILLIILAACANNADETQVVATVQRDQKSEPSLTESLNPTELPSVQPSFTPLPSITPSPSEIPTILDYSKIGKIQDLIIDPGKLDVQPIEFPPILFEPYLQTIDLTKDGSEVCGEQCVKRQWIGQSGNLTMLISQYGSQDEATDHMVTLAKEYEAKEGLGDWAIADQYDGGREGIWAAGGGLSVAYASVQGPILVYSEWKFDSATGFDFDAPYYLGQLSCISEYQLSLISVEASEGSLDPLEPSSKCMITV
jgi:hypothetical protein